MKIKYRLILLSFWMYNKIIEYNRPSKYLNLLPCICHCLSNRMKREYSNKCYFNRTQTLKIMIKLNVMHCYSQCWSESGLVSPAVSPSPQGQSPSPSPSPSDQSPSPSVVSPSPLDQSPSPSPSPLDQSPSPSPSPVGQSPSPRVQQKSKWVRTRVRTQPGLMSPTIEKCFVLTLLLIIFAEPCIATQISPLFLLTYSENNRRKHIGSNHYIV